MSQCLPRPLIQRYVNEECATDEIRTVETHLEACARFRRSATNEQVVGRIRACMGQESLHELRPVKRPEETTTRLSVPVRNRKDASILPDVGSIPDFRIQKAIYRGSQGVVYQVVQLGIKRKVAMKVMLEGPFAGPESRRHFEREIELIRASNT